MTGHDKAELAAIRQQLEQMLAALNALEKSIGTTEDRPASGSGDWQPDLQSLGAATAILRRRHQTAAKIVRKNGLGVFVNGTWSVDLNRCRALMEGRPYPPLEPFPKANQHD